jgi:protein-arginine kinase
MEFAKADGLGYLTFCPTNLGTTMRASVHVRVPMLSKDPKVLNDICAKYNLQPRGMHASIRLQLCFSCTLHTLHIYIKINKY